MRGRRSARLLPFPHVRGAYVLQVERVRLDRQGLGGLRDTAALQASSASVARERASSSRTSSYLNAGATLLNAGTSYYGATSKIAAAGKVA